MPFKNIHFSSFRNLYDGSLELLAERIFFIGENGQGKTNILEALYFLSYGSSFRSTPDSEAATRGSSRFSLLGKGISMNSGLEGMTDEIRVSLNGKVKDIRVDGKKIRDRKELVQKYPVIAFCHEDFSFAAGEPDRRRFFFDQTAGLVSPAYIDTLRDYKRILKQRNLALKGKRYDLLDAYDFQLALTGSELSKKRSRLQTDLDGLFSLRYEAVALLGSDVRIAYRPSWPSELNIEGITERLRYKRSEESIVGTSLSGPHRDRWSFIREGKDYSTTASTGQRRLLSLILRIVQAEYYIKTTGRLPVLLLDDVLLELDRGKRRRFLDLLPRSGQSFYTFLPGEPWEDYRSASTLVYEVKDGRFSD